MVVMLNRKQQMKKKNLLISSLVVATGLIATSSFTGCSTTNISDLVKAASQDTNHVSLHVMSPWGVAIDYERNKP